VGGFSLSDRAGARACACANPDPDFAPPDPNPNACRENAEEHGAEIARLITGRLSRAPPNKKLPVLYLLDSVSKKAPLSHLRRLNSFLVHTPCSIGKAGKAYLPLFAPEICQHFLRAFEACERPVQERMAKVLKTWPTVFRDQYAIMEAAQTQLEPEIRMKSTIPTIEIS
jgi:hypothetical protein